MTTLKELIFDLPKNPIRISSILEDRQETSEFQKQLLEQKSSIITLLSRTDSFTVETPEPSGAN